MNYCDKIKINGNFFDFNGLIIKGGRFWIYEMDLNLCRSKLRSRRGFTTYQGRYEVENRVEDPVVDSIDREILRGWWK